MKILKKLMIGVVLCALILPMAFPVFAGGQSASPGVGRRVDILFTHDVHSHLESFRTYFRKEEQEVGGMARMMTVIQKQRQDHPDTLLIDGGDFSMGTVYQMLYEDEAPELRMFGMLGYDATTLGNHEFDYRSEGLANMLNSAARSGDALPAFVVCNVKWPGELTDEQRLLKRAFDRYGVEPYTVVKKGNVKIALIGVFGKDALACVPNCALEFEDPVSAVKRTVKEIKEKEDVDMIVCLSHSGTRKDPEKSEDEILAKEVPQLDLILSAHSHTVLEQPIIHGNTAIVSCGEYGMQMGQLSMEQTKDGRWSVSEYELIPLTKEVAQNRDVLDRLSGFSDLIDENYLGDYGYTKDMVLAENAYDFASVKNIYSVKKEHNLSNLIADAFFYAASELSDQDIPVDVAVVPSGCVRDTLVRGQITVADVFKTYSLGIGADGKAGYPLIGVYLNGDELRAAAEIDASISDFMNSARLYPSGLSYEYNPNRMILNKITKVKLDIQEPIPYLDEDETDYEELDNDKLYYVVADLYTGQMLETVQKMSLGIISIKPKDATGQPIENLEDCILHDKNGNEIKAWTAIADYMKVFPKENGKTVVPDYYAKLHGRKLVEDSKALKDLLKHPSKYAVLLCLVAVMAAAVIFLVVRGVIKLCRSRAHRKKGKKANGK